MSTGEKKYFRFQWYLIRFILLFFITVAIYRIAPGFKENFIIIIRIVTGLDHLWNTMLAYLLPASVLLYMKIIYDLLMQDELE